MTEKEKLENIAEVALLRTSLVKLITQTKELDYLAYHLHDPQKMVGIEVKETDFSYEAAQIILIKHQGQMENLRIKKQIPMFLFLLNMKKENGFFTVFDGNNTHPLYPLKLDILSEKLSKALGLGMPLEFPPYKFYKRGKEKKLETWSVDVGGEFSVLRLHNTMLSPISLMRDLILEVIISPASSSYLLYKRSFIDVYQNKNLPDHLFFTNGNISHTDIALPEGRKHVTFKLKSNTPLEDFECVLACEWLTEAQAKHIERFR